jgi:hypothetical protein
MTDEAVLSQGATLHRYDTPNRSQRQRLQTPLTQPPLQFSFVATIAKDFERRSLRECLGSNMTKLIALITAGLFAAGTMFAGEHGNCTKQVGSQAKAACQVSLASLNLTPEQKTKMDAAMAEHQKAGCSEASEAKYLEQAKAVLTPEQYAKFKAQCKKGEKGNTQT